MNMTFSPFGRATPVARARDRFEVIPAGGERERQERSKAAKAKLELYALAAQQQARKAASARRNVRARDDRGGMMLVKRGPGSIENSLERLDAAIVQLSTPSVGEVTQRWHSDYATREARLCADAKAAYDARNPHKNREG